MRVVNRRAAFFYFLLEKFEAGIVLTGPEVKAVKAKRIDLNESFVRLKDHEAWLHNAYIHSYSPAGNQQHHPTRPRKLLLHKRELLKLAQKTKQKGLTIVPVACYTKGRNIKLEIALAKGKKEFQKREAKKRKDLDRETARELSSRG